MVKGSITEHFSWNNLKPVHSEPILFVVSQWQSNKTQSGVIYLIYRTAVAAFLLTTWGMTFMESSWPIFLTNWGYTLVTFQATLGFVLSCATVLSNVFSAKNIHDSFLKLYPVYWVLHQMAVSIGFMITIIFWTILAPGMPFVLLSFFVHGCNSILLFIDLLIIGHPIRILHFVYPLMFGVSYAIFSVAYYYYDINRGGSGYVYFILDWNKPLPAFLVVLGVALLIVFLHLFSFIIHTLKLLLHNRLYPESAKSTTNKTQSTEQLPV
ncbi:protein rolling stone-like isoform X1 [Anoplophora glabripennis]|uniref:protein rolling stone-like isoform X1 n=1 Tax=Anoplophora glabripennis TaxID=217634 RepID=UPI0008735A65|nr:protein rolling stone-like isoform X1 [Anoplophora glabripennis]